MDAKEYAKIVARNLRRIAIENGKQQIDIARDLGVNKATVSSWMNGTRTPKMDKKVCSGLIFKACIGP